LAAQDDAPVRVVVVGGGAGGVELSLAMHRRLRAELAKIGKSPDLAHVALVTQGAAILENHNLRVQELMVEEFRTKNIALHVNSCVVSSTTDDSGCKYLVTKAGDKIPFDECVWCTSANGQQWIRATGLEVTEDGFICVHDTLQTTRHPDVFACGDCCHMVNTPRPKSGVFAVRQGPFINNNIRHRLLNEPLEPYIPQSQWLGLIGTGDGRCVASRGPIALKGEYLWQLKDSIDRGWMRGYQELPSMTMAAPAVPDVAQASGEHALRMLSQAAMRCGGCGSKVGSSILTRALANVRQLNHHRDEIVAGLDSPDDVALIQPPGPGYLLVQTVDFFKNFLSDPFLFGKIAANHALSDCHAKNAAALSAMAIVVLPYGFEEKMEATLTQILAGACQVLAQVGCALVGGHTSEGEELALGFAITGTVAVGSVLRKGGVQGGYSIILTKSLGTGTLMAADMRVKARGVWVDSAIQSMLQSNSGAAAILHDHGCAACTDVTGFGLIGHLLEMLQASSPKKTDQSSSAYGAKLLLDHIPVLPGAVECVQQVID
jgi:selenide,water dikinase